MKIGSFDVASLALLAPMAGATDRPFRELCRRYGAGYAVSEMVASNPRLRDSRKSARRVVSELDAEPRVLQIVGADPATMADAARHGVDQGAQIIDINMGCPARKVCNTMAGSALMADEDLATRIIAAVCSAVAVPVTVKMRTGPAPERANAPLIARRAEQAGAAMVVIHGRSRACGFRGDATYQTVAEVKAVVKIPVVANGDIDSPAKARAVLDATDADAVMIGRAALGRPWLCGEIDHFLATGELLPAPSHAEVGRRISEHLLAHYEFHGEFEGLRSARKRVGWYLEGMPGAAAFIANFNRFESAAAQLAAIDQFFAPGAASDRTMTWREAA